ncbi:ABC transporter substrate-binding protein [Paenibacillus foliorum]|nr:ABC transporter substrate-binding protein [Paenibacillus foliorum]
MKKTVLMLFALILSISLTACGSSAGSGSAASPKDSPKAAPAAGDTKAAATTDSGTKDKKKKRIAYVAGITTDAFYISMKFGAEEVAKKLDVDLIWTGAPEWDYTKQTPIVDSLIAEKVDAIIIAPNDAKAMVAPLKKAMNAGIPVFTVDTNVSDDSAYVANVTSDNLQGGKLGANTLAKEIGEKGKVLVMNTKPGITTTDDRQKGFLEEIKKYPNIQVVATEYCDDQATIAAKKTQDILLANPDLSGVFAANVVSGAGVAQGLRVKNVQDKVKLVSYDAGPEQVKSLKAKELQAIISQKPLEEARIILQMTYDYLNGKKDVKKITVLENVSVTPENIETPDVQQWLYRTK